MKVQYSYLKNFLPTDLSQAKLVDIFTKVGFECELNKSIMPKLLNSYLVGSKEFIVKVIEDKLIHQINNKDIYKNDLYITSISELFYYSNNTFQ